MSTLTAVTPERVLQLPCGYSTSLILEAGSRNQSGVAQTLLAIG